MRFRLTAAATLVVAVMLAAASVAIVAIQRNALEAGLDAELATRAVEIELSIAGGLVTQEVANPRSDDQIVQIVDLLNRVVAASPNLAGSPPIADWNTGIRNLNGLPADEGPFRVLTTETTRTGEPLTIHVGATYEDIAESTRVLAGVLAVAVPGLSLLLGALTWWLVGRALRPVEEIRTEVESISDAEPTARVPVPSSGDEISRLASTMNGMLERLEQSAERQRQFVSDASHELRSPLARMRALLEVDRSHPATADPAASQASLLDETIRMQHLVDDLLHLARTDAGAEGSHHEPVDLDDIVRREVEVLSIEHDASIDTAAVQAIQVMGNAGQLSRLVRNLVENAIRHHRSVIQVSLTERNEAVELAVIDDGPGIPLGQQSVIFERFARLDQARSGDRGGSGLGLAIARDIATRHSGSIRVDSSYAGGARLVVEMPRHI